jgi:hypothetical protein
MLTYADACRQHTCIGVTEASEQRIRRALDLLHICGAEEGVREPDAVVSKR